MKKVISYANLLVLCLVNFSCGNFLNEYSQTAAYIETVDDLDELLIAEGYLVENMEINLNLLFCIFWQMSHKKQ